MRSDIKSLLTLRSNSSKYSRILQILFRLYDIFPYVKISTTSCEAPSIRFSPDSRFPSFPKEGNNAPSFKTIHTYRRARTKTINDRCLSTGHLFYCLRHELLRIIHRFALQILSTLDPDALVAMPHRLRLSKQSVSASRHLLK